MNESDKVANFRKNHIGRYLHEMDRAFKKITVPYIQNNGFRNFTEGQLNILGSINMNKPTPTKDLINELNLSKQAVSRMVAICEENGFIERVKSKTDSRSKDIIFSQKGVELMKTAKRATQFAEEEFVKKIGPERFLSLKETLAEICDELDIIHID